MADDSDPDTATASESEDEKQTRTLTRNYDDDDDDTESEEEEKKKKGPRLLQRRAYRKPLRRVSPLRLPRRPRVNKQLWEQNKGGTVSLPVSPRVDHKPYCVQSRGSGGSGVCHSSSGGPGHTLP